MAAARGDSESMIMVRIALACLKDVADDATALVPRPVRKATFDSLIHERLKLAADQTRSNFHLPPNDTTIPFAIPIPAPSVDDPILEDRAADHTPPSFPLSPAPPDGAVPTMPVRKPTFDSLVLERLAADRAHPTFSLAPDDATIHVAMPIPTPSVDSPILERRAADHAPPLLPVRKPTFDSLILERLAAEHTHPTVPLARDDYAHHTFPLPPAPPTFPPPPPLILSTRPHRSLFQRLRLRRKPKPCLSIAISSVMEAAVVPWMYPQATSASNSSPPPSHRVE